MPPKLPKAKPKPAARRGATTGQPTTQNLPAEGSAASLSHAAVLPEASAAATDPTETKEIPTTAPPKGRLDSLTSPSTRGGPLRGAVGSKIKFKPKVVQRRTKEERETLDAKFQEQQATKSSRGGSGRGGGRGGRGGGRGGRGRGGGGLGFSDVLPGASGPFALGSVVTGRRDKVFAERSGTGIFGGSGSSRAMRYKSNVKRDPRDGDDKGGYSSSDDSDGPKMDVEYISLLDAASDDDEMDGEERDMTNDWGAGAPVRIPRSEHVDRQAMVNTDSSAKKGKAELKAMKDKEMTFETEIKIKAEPEDDDLGMLPPSSPEMTKRKVKVSDSPEVKRKKEPTSPVRRRRRSSVLGKKPIISTTEEKEEYERLETDRNDALLELGGAMNGLGLDTGKARDPDNDVEMFSPTAAPQPTANAETENQIFCFQFPPLLPRLVDFNLEEKKPQSKEAEEDDTKPDVKIQPGSFAARKLAAQNK
ncbi:hypothetical protein BZA05DRAFT_412775, partial [Tricharina praecox]|uniref:uncharacterized protein n=1 Tax=Tricharina praecox TaxID=43433 RepID=UPI00221EA28A